MLYPPQWLEPAFHPTYARLLCTLLRVRGVDIEALLAGTGLSSVGLQDSYCRLNFIQIRHIIHAALRFTELPSLGLTLGAATQAAAHGATGYAALAAKDVAQAMDLLGRYAKLRTSTLDLRLVQGREGEMSRILMREQFDLGDVRIFICESALVVIVRLLEAMLGQRLPQLEYRFPYPAPAWAGAYAAHLDGKCSFDAACLEIRLPSELLHTPCLTADPQACASACKDCEQGLVQLSHNSDITQQVRLRFLNCEGDYPDSSAMAAALNMSVRTLIRKLHQHDTSFQILRDESRKELAQWYLQNTAYPIERIAERLGYQDASNFSRCFRRWFGVTPKQARAAAGGE